MKASKSQTAFMIGAVAWAGFSIAVGVVGGIFGGDTEYPMTAAEKLTWWLVAGLGGVMLLVGLRAWRRLPLLGGVLMAVGALAAGVIMWWSIVIPVLAILVAVFGVVRARRFARELQAIS